MMDVDESGRLTPGMPGKSTYWWELWTHILEELTLRRESYMGLDLMPEFPWVSHPNVPRGLRILGKNKLPSSYIARLGQREHLKASMNLGRFRIAPAASYSDPSLNPAIRDDELSVTAIRSGDTALIHAIDPTTGKQGERIPTIGEITFSTALAENFYVLCMTAQYSPRLLDDFDADAILVITNIDRFILRLEREVRKVRADLVLAANGVRYYDPYRVRPDMMDHFYAKNFRYAYQKEYRFIWHTPGLPIDCQSFFVDIGNMRDIASIHVLRD